MIKINFLKHSEEWEFEGLKVIQTKENDKLMIDIIKSINNGEFELLIDDKNISASSILIINNYTQTKDLLNFNKSNKFIDFVFEKIDIQSILSNINIDSKVNSINSVLKSSYLESNSNKTKLLGALVDLNNDFISKDELLFYLDLNKNVSGKQTIFINNIYWLGIKDIEKYLDYYNFIFITTDISKVFKDVNFSSLDGIIVNFRNNQFNEIQSLDILCSYLSESCNLLIEEGELKKIICGSGSDKNDVLEKIAKI